MKNEKDNKFVAIVHEICIICCSKMNEQILVHRRFGDMSEVDGKAMRFASTPCEECMKGIAMGAIMFIVIDVEKSGDMKPGSWYRTGNIFGIRKEAARRIFDEKKFADAEKYGFALIDYKDAIEIGMPVDYDPNQIQKQNKS